jgi:hypothetical protein
VRRQDDLGAAEHEQPRRLGDTRSKRGDAIDLFERRGVPAVWRRSITEALKVSICSMSGSRRSTASSIRCCAPSPASAPCSD